jgi:hypothetical protein
LEETLQLVMETTTEKPDTQVKQEMREQHRDKKTERRL